MHIDYQDKKLVISGVRELTALTAPAVRDQVKTRLSAESPNVDLELSGVEFIDSSGLGALISMQKAANQHGGKMRLLSPRASVVQVLELTRLHRVFEIVLPVAA